MNVAFAPEAIEDLSAAITFLGERNLSAAVRLSDRIFGVAMSLAEGEFDGPEQELRRTGERVRSWPVPPFRICYRRKPDPRGPACVPFGAPADRQTQVNRAAARAR